MDLTLGIRPRYWTVARSPTFAVLSDTEHQPVVDDMPSELTEAAETCENVLPMKRSVYYRS